MTICPRSASSIRRWRVPTDRVVSKLFPRAHRGSGHRFKFKRTLTKLPDCSSAADGCKLKARRAAHRRGHKRKLAGSSLSDGYSRTIGITRWQRGSRWRLVDGGEGETVRRRVLDDRITIARLVLVWDRSETHGDSVERDAGCVECKSICNVFKGVGRRKIKVESGWWMWRTEEVSVDGWRW